MNHLRNTVVAVAAAAALSLVAACGDVEPPATDIGKSVAKQNLNDSEEAFTTTTLDTEVHIRTR